MESMEDSGFDSDPKATQNGSIESPLKSESSEDVPIENGWHKHKQEASNTVKALRKTSELQKKLAEKQREAARKAQNHGASVVDNQPKKNSLLARNRIPKYSKLVVPVKGQPGAQLTGDRQPLVMLDSDDSDDEFGNLDASAYKEITQQLIHDGYNLDLEPDDEDLDLIPPRPMHDRCICCQYTSTGCIIQ